MKNTEVLEKYSKALSFVAIENKNAARISENLEILSMIFEHNLISNFFSSPIVPLEVKREFLDKLLLSLELTSEVKSLATILLENGRLSLLRDLSKAFERLRDEDDGVTRGVVRAPRPLTSEAKRDFEKSIHEILKKKVLLSFEEDASLIGGVVAQVGGWTFDDSLKTHLRNMSETLSRN